jgi:Spy/CpxP family protein refolding chaperone
MAQAPHGDCLGHAGPRHHHEQAQASHSKDRRPPPGSMMGGLPMMAVMHALCSLDLTDVQQMQVKTIHEQTHSKMAALLDSDRGLQTQLMTTLPGDEGYTALIETVKSNAGLMIQLHSDAMVQIYQSVLTDAQRTQVAHLLATKKQRGESHHANPHADQHPKD